MQQCRYYLWIISRLFLISHYASTCALCKLSEILPSLCLFGALGLLVGVRSQAYAPLVRALCLFGAGVVVAALLMTLFELETALVGVEGEKKRKWFCSWFHACGRNLEPTFGAATRSAFMDSGSSAQFNVGRGRVPVKRTDTLVRVTPPVWTLTNHEWILEHELRWWLMITMRNQSAGPAARLQGEHQACRITSRLWRWVRRCVSGGRRSLHSQCRLSIVADQCTRMLK